MMEQHSRLLRILKGLALVLAGFLLAGFVLRFPATFHLPHILRASGPQEKAPAKKQLWTCSMHPQIVQDHPGDCPICGMKLVPVASKTAASTDSKPAERKILYYRNPMNPTVTSPVPMKDEMGMDYVPVFEDEEEPDEEGTVRIDPVVVQDMGVLTERAQVRDIRQNIRTVGYLDYDQEKMVAVTTKYTGFIERVYVNYVGQPVKKGDPLFEVYSPQLIQTEQELLSSLEFAHRMQDASPEMRQRAQDLIQSARERLAYWDIGAAQIRTLEDSGKVFRTLTVTAPASGLIMKRMDGLKGMAIQPGMNVYHIAGMSNLWLDVEVFESQLAWVEVGSRAKVTFPYFPAREFRGRVRFVEPGVSDKTRTVKVTLEVPNPDGKLRAGMYATAEFNPVLAGSAVTIPSTSVLRTGQRNVVVVALGNGRFLPRNVDLGSEGDGYVQVLSGIQPGEEVVTSAQFLIDSESNLQAAITKMAHSEKQS